MNTTKSQFKGFRRRMVALLLLVSLLVTALPVPAGAASYMDAYLNKMVSWGFMKGDAGGLRPYSNITRAEFVTIVNRAFGYDNVGTTPFKDVRNTDWFAEDVAIAYTAGYIQGTSATTFSPQKEITREEAAVILARNLMMQAGVGENTDFTDSRQISTWSRGLISTVVQYQLVNGYPDGSFRPKDPITRGETAVLLVKAIGTPVQTAGSQTLGNVYGNVTINTSGVTLRNTVIAGNLYITGGVDLGDVLLENVTVLGEIVVSGGGVSESGDDSVVLRNVTSPKLVVDNLKNQKVSLRVDGDGDIDTASVRTNAYVLDATPDGHGLLRLELDGEDGTVLELAGNLKEVVNLTPKSYLSLSAGQADTITVDEAATGTTLNLVAGTEATNVNLDVGATVTGDGDIGKLVVNAAGSTVTMLPDTIEIRPGVEATIAGEKMDSAAAAESSADPRLLAGYPKMTDLAPTTATAQFSANKKGIVYWAVTSVTDGSVEAADLINPPSYSNKILKRGTVSTTGSNQPVNAKISGLTAGGSYYLSVVFVDGREEQSPVKVISFTTPDNTVPNFASGYPYLSRITMDSAQVVVMATKTCRLYYAVLPKGASAPTGDDFKANAIPGNKGYGSMDVTKNTPYTFDVNNVPLDELASYDLYLWLTDIEGGSSSAVKKLSFTTVDGTPPIFKTEPTINSVKETSVGLYANLNEAGTLYWVIVPEGEVYPKPMAGQTGAVDWTSNEAKIQVANGMNGDKSGKVTMTAGKDVSFTISGLEKESSYDLYYVAQDKAGNYTASIGKITIHTLDNTAPTVTQEFTKYNGTDTTKPLSDTDVRLVFSETVQAVSNNTPLVDLYNDVTKVVGQGTAETDARKKMATVLENAIQLYLKPANGQPLLMSGVTSDNDKNGGDWTIDYRYAEITVEDGKTVITFPYETAINLKSGAKYYFQIAAKSISDTSQSQNVMGETKLPEFDTVFAQVNLSAVNLSKITTDKDGAAQGDTTVHAVWQLNPVSTQRVEDSMDWDMLIWTDTSLSFNLYRRTGTTGNWEKLNTKPIAIQRSDATQGDLGVSLTRDFLKTGQTSPDFDPLNLLREDTTYQYAMEFVTINGESDPLAWNGRVDIRVSVLAGSSTELRLMASNITESNWNDTVVNGPVSDIGLPEDFTIKVPFTDQSLPSFTSEYPKFTPDATEVDMQLLLNRSGTVYYVIAPVGSIVTKDDANQDYGAEDIYGTLPKDGTEDDKMPTFIHPEASSILNPSTQYNQNPAIKYGNVTVQSSVVHRTVTGLEPETDYIAYFVIQNTAQQYSSVMCYRFKTTTVGTPYITLENQSPKVQFKTSENSELYYALVAYDEMPNLLMNTTFYSDTYMSSEQKKAFADAGLDQKMTILDALMMTEPQNGGTEGPSVFDLYANEDAKKQVGSLIRQNQSSIQLVSVAAGTMNLSKNTAQVKDFTSKMKEGTSYFCLAVARNQDGILDGFKVIGDVSIPDEDPPTLEVYTVAQTNQAGTAWSGTVTLTFSENLYWLGEDQKTLKEVWTAKPSTAYQKNKAIYILDSDVGMGYTCSSLTPSSNSSTSSASFTFDFTGARQGSTITIFRTGYASDSHMNGRERITLTFKTEGAGVGGFATSGRFVITSNALPGDSPTQ